MWGHTCAHTHIPCTGTHVLMNVCAYVLVTVMWWHEYTPCMGCCECMHVCTYEYILVYILCSCYHACMNLDCVSGYESVSMSMWVCTYVCLCVSVVTYTQAHTCTHTHMLTFTAEPVSMGEWGGQGPWWRFLVLGYHMVTLIIRRFSSAVPLTFTEWKQPKLWWASSWER